MDDQPYKKNTMTPDEEEKFVKRQAKAGNVEKKLEELMEKRKPPSTSKAVKKAKGGGRGCGAAMRGGGKVMR
jgi:hypothetical protein